MSLKDLMIREARPLEGSKHRVAKILKNTNRFGENLKVTHRPFYSPAADQAAIERSDPAGTTLDLAAAGGGM